MLQLKNIVKTYVTGTLTQDALNNISIAFRESEFVSVLGQSGSGKTTMLNIIGGLDRYTEGDLIINGVSTKKYKDSDWDSYRNNSIGFVFQSYNLIPHQTVLSNVEMALTLAGVSKKERRARAKAVLEKVGLADQLHKKPNQMSGGQMQRVAIARALVNNPDILLADEPTGALDSETSLQIMELLKEIAKEKLVIMVTHNPELAEKYSTRIVRLLDGRIVSDSNPFNAETENKTSKRNNKVSMSFFTALALSFNNLSTKKGRTLLTAFAGSIGIIGIALILALSTGMNQYITDIQKETMTSYPVTVTAEAVDMSGFIGMQGERIGEVIEQENKNDSLVYADYTELKAGEMMTSSIVENNLTAFKKYLDNPESEIHSYVGENGIKYSYNVDFSVFSYNPDDKLTDSSEEPDNSSDTVKTSERMGMMMRMSGAMPGSVASGAENFSELMPGTASEVISHVVTDNYETVCGRWPRDYNEVVLVLNSQNGISAGDLYQLGLISEEQYNSAVEQIEETKNAKDITLEMDKLLEHTFYLVPACDRYEKDENGNFSFIENSVTNEDKIIENSLELQITGIVRPIDSESSGISTSVGYTSLLTDYLIEHTNKSAVIKAQEKDSTVNVLTGMRFESPDEDAKVQDAKEYLKGLGISEKASFFKLMMYYAPSDEQNPMMAMSMDETSMASYLDIWLENEPDREVLLSIYDEYIAGASYEDNMRSFGKVSYDAPSAISIYTDSFENKDAISLCIEKYNEGVSEDERITYTDYVALITSSITTIINGISYVLVAFVAISLIVSCIMIGIITHISVLERTKEIGILRALGASKRNISQVFNAETFIIGCCAGILGIGVSFLALVPINSLIQKISGIPELGAVLPLGYSAVLIVISIIITMLGGLLPAKKAAKKDPVIALRTE